MLVSIFEILGFNQKSVWCWIPLVFSLGCLISSIPLFPLFLTFLSTLIIQPFFESLSCLGSLIHLIWCQKYVLFCIKKLSLFWTDGQHMQLILWFGHMPVKSYASDIFLLRDQDNFIAMLHLKSFQVHICFRVLRILDFFKKLCDILTSLCSFLCWMYVLFYQTFSASVLFLSMLFNFLCDNCLIFKISSFLPQYLPWYISIIWPNVCNHVIFKSTRIPASSTFHVTCFGILCVLFWRIYCRNRTQKSADKLECTIAGILLFLIVEIWSPGLLWLLDWQYLVDYVLPNSRVFHAWVVGIFGMNTIA